jgi:hypothetical protein
MGIDLPKRGDRWSDEVAYHLGVMVMHARIGTLALMYPELYSTMIQLLALEMISKLEKE